MPQKGSSRHHPRGRSPTPSTGTDSEDNSKKVSKHKQKRKSSSHQKRKHASRSQNSNAEKNTKIPNSHDLEAVDTSEIKELNRPIHLHLRVLMRRPDATSPIPSPPTTSEKLALENQYAEADYPDDLAPCLLPPNPLVRITNCVSDTFCNTLEMTLRRWGLARFTFDWDGNFDDAFNQISVQFFLKTFKLAINTFEYGLRPLTKYRDTRQLVAVVFRAFKSLRAGYKAQISNPLVLRDRYESNESKKETELRLTEYREFLKQSGVCREIASVFKRKNFMIMGEVEEVETRIGRQIEKERRVYHSQWWSEKMIKFMNFLEKNVQLTFQLTVKRRGSKRIPITYVPSPHQDFQNVPEGLPCDLYSSEFMSVLLPAMLQRYNRTPACLPSLDQDIKSVFPQPEDMINYSTDDSLASLSDEESSQSDHINIIKKKNSDIEMRHVKWNQHNNSNNFLNSEPGSSSNRDISSKATSNSPPSNALILYSTPHLDDNTPLHLDANPSSPTLDTTAEVEELQIALKSQQAIMDQRLSLLNIDYQSKLQEQLEAERKLMRDAIEEEKRQLMSAMLKDQENLEIEKNRIVSEKEELNKEKERIIAEKNHINASVIAEKERIEAVVAAEKNRIDAAVLAEKERINTAVAAAQVELESERQKLKNEKHLQQQIEHQLPIERGATTHLQHFQPQPASSSQSPNHLYPPSHPQQPSPT